MLNKLLNRVLNILVQPRKEWPVIAEEQTEPLALYLNYIAILAVIPALATFLSMALVGTLLAGRMGAGMALWIALTGYVMSLVMVFVIAFIADALAPSFEGHKDLNRALRLTAYAMTASWVAGILAFLPVIGLLIALLGFLYSLYLFYLGAPLLMKVPEHKVVGYTVVVVAIAIVVGFVIGMLNATIFGSGMAGMMGGMRF
ncbi:MAG: YIP1 family protein [Burkholderiales bacterium]|nr:YIP1 family protein [Burkholderiales bacterium]